MCQHQDDKPRPTENIPAHKPADHPDNCTCSICWMEKSGAFKGEGIQTGPIDLGPLMRFADHKKILLQWRYALFISAAGWLLTFAMNQWTIHRYQNFAKALQEKILRMEATPCRQK